MTHVQIGDIPYLFPRRRQKKVATIAASSAAIVGFSSAARYHNGSYHRFRESSHLPTITAHNALIVATVGT